MTSAPELPERAGLTQPSTSLWLTVLGIGVAVAMLALGCLAMIEARHDAWNQAAQGARNLLLALDRDIGRNVATLDLSLQGVGEALAEPGINQADPSVRHRALFDRSASAEDLGSLLVLDTNGDVVEDSTSVQPHRLSLGDRDYFRVHRDRADVGLYVSRPFRSRLAGGDLRFAITRRLSSPDGRFLGVVEGALRLDHFRRLFEKLELGSQSNITLVRSDGRILMRSPFLEADIDRDLSQGATFQHIVKAKSGQYVANTATDGIERLYTFRQIGDLPLILTINLSTTEIYAGWTRKALIIGPVLAVLCASAVASCLLFRREVLRRGKAEQALALAAEKLSVIASTDSLTGLANRRTFEAEFDRAFRRTVRIGSVLTVIMFDADFFKRYNDEYGHLAGDDVLRAIANCMTRHLRRPDDLVARYGGEEFVAVLPNTDMHSATIVADRIRAAVADLAINHAKSEFGRVTISIGVSTGSPFVYDDPNQLVQTADQALYCAKREGRNCVKALETNYLTNSMGLTDPEIQGFSAT